MVRIINLTQHKATPEQVTMGVVDLPEPARAELCKLLTFNSLPSTEEILGRAEAIANMAKGYDMAMIGGALWLMSPLAQKLKDRCIVPVFSFSVRETTETVSADGTVTKTSVFRHRGFVAAI